MTEHLAHVSEDKSRFHLLEDHLIGVADLASTMAAEFGASEWAYLAGLWHDLGKYSAEFEWESAIYEEDVRRDYGERRIVAIGFLEERLHILCFTPIEDGARIIGFRKANAREVKIYEQETADR